jgi:hypothetical protein
VGIKRLFASFRRQLYDRENNKMHTLTTRGMGSRNAGKDRQEQQEQQLGAQELQGKAQV